MLIFQFSSSDKLVILLQLQSHYSMSIVLGS